MHDIARQGHATLSVTFLISSSRDARAMIFVLFCRFLGQGCQIYIYIYFHTVSIKRDLVTRTRDNKGHAQGHVTLTYKVTLDSYSVELYIFDIRDPKNLQNKKKIIALAPLEPEITKVTLMVT